MVVAGFGVGPGVQVLVEQGTAAVGFDAVVLGFHAFPVACAVPETLLGDEFGDGHGPRDDRGAESGDDVGVAEGLEFAAGRYSGVDAGTERGGHRQTPYLLAARAAALTLRAAASASRYARPRSDSISTEL